MTLVLPEGGESSSATNSIDNQRINLAFSKIGSEECALICRTLMDPAMEPPIRCVDLTDNQLGPEGAEKIASSLETSAVEELLLRYNAIGRAGCDAVGTVLNISSRLRLLDLRGNRLQTSDLRRLAKGISLSTHLTTIGLHDNELGPEGAALIAASLEKNSCVTFLDLSKNEMGPHGAMSIAKLIATSTSVIQTLHLWCNKFGPEGVTSIVDAVADNKKLVNLSIGNNHATNASCKAIGAMIAKNRKLKTLELRSNSISEQGIRELCAAGFPKLSTCSLETIVLSGNPIGPVGGDVLVKALIGCSNVLLQSLDLWSCGLGSSGVIRIASLMIATPSIREVNLSVNEADDESAVAIAKAIVASKGIVSVDLSGNNIQAVGATDLLEAMQANPQLASLLLHNNRVSRVVQKKIDALVATRKTATK
jgi:Ran GTPase-activating protein (RanGAP) involved in mRNA processing and transport